MSRGWASIRSPTGLTSAALAALLAGNRSQLKGVLTDQTVIAGIGNAYSDEILHAAKLSPFKPAANLTPEEVDRLYAAMRDILGAAVERAAGQPAAELKDEQAQRHARARPHRPAVPGLRRHRARGVVRRLVAAVLPDVPDRRQAARRPAAVAAAEVIASPVTTGRTGQASAHRGSTDRPG